MKIGILDCGGANLNSIKFSLNSLGIDSIISNDACELERADKLIIPGVGASDIVMKKLNENSLDVLLKSFNKPILGICVGMQVLFEHSQEGDTCCLGLLKGKVEKLKSTYEHPTPHMGWNYVNSKYKEICGYYYYANSYGVISPENEIASTDYVNTIAAVVKKNNLYGCQFHPEKSSQAGINFINFFINDS